MNGDYRVVTVDGREVFEHRHVMARHLGRDLTKDEQVHHRNGDRRDNRIENLEVIDASTHGLLHSPVRTHCRRGHALVGENVHYVRRSRKKGRSNVERWCRACMIARAARV